VAKPSVMTAGTVGQNSRPIFLRLCYFLGDLLCEIFSEQKTTNNFASPQQFRGPPLRAAVSAGSVVRPCCGPRISLVYRV